METSNSTPSFAHSSRSLHPHLSFPMAPSGSQTKYAHPQLPLVDLNEKSDAAQYHPCNYPAPLPTTALPQQSRPHHPALTSSYPETPLHYSRTVPTSAYTRPRGLRIANLLKPWIPIILYAFTSLGFLVAIALWKAEVFQGAHFRRPTQSLWSFTFSTIKVWTISRTG